MSLKGYYWLYHYLWTLTKEKSSKLIKIMYIVSSDTLWHPRLIFSACLFSLQQICKYAFMRSEVFMHSCAEDIPPTYLPTCWLHLVYSLCTAGKPLWFLEKLRIPVSINHSYMAKGQRLTGTGTQCLMKNFNPLMCLSKSHLLHL